MTAARGIVEIDVHGMTWYQAVTAVEALIRRTGRATYRIRVVHGYNSGTRLRDMIRRHFSRHPAVIRIEVGLNPGQTDLVLRELFSPEAR